MSLRLTSTLWEAVIWLEGQRLPSPPYLNGGRSEINS
jgi:hypothetical protein